LSASYGITRSGSPGSYTYSVTGTLANRPVVFVSWFDAARMANWMMNGQGSGSTETRAYTLNWPTPTPPPAYPENTPLLLFLHSHAPPKFNRFMRREHGNQ
jgi:hypothetical protein